jgi:hypothetical protein
MSMHRHLRIQLTLLSAGPKGRPAPIPPGEFATVLAAGGRQFSAALALHETAVPGGAAVHGEATLIDPEEARPFFPPGTQFELRDGGRKGYGFVLAQLS